MPSIGEAVGYFPAKIQVSRAMKTTGNNNKSRILRAMIDA
jgi:hypothetical protein